MQQHSTTTACVIGIQYGALHHFTKSTTNTPTKHNTMTKNISEASHLLLPVPKPRPITEYVRESQLLLWIWRMISEISCIDYEQYLRDGVVLCHLIKHLAPNTVACEVNQFGGNKRQKRVNIERFLDSCRAYGVSEEHLFDVEDLLSMQDIPRVTRCLYALGQQASDKLVSPKLGKPYDQWLDERISNFNRRNGLPIGDDLYVSHVNTEWLKQKLERRKAISGLSVQRPPREPLVQRTPSKPLNELRAIFTNTTSLKVQTNVDC